MDALEWADLNCEKIFSKAFEKFHIRICVILIKIKIANQFNFRLVEMLSCSKSRMFTIIYEMI